MRVCLSMTNKESCIETFWMSYCLDLASALRSRASWPTCRASMNTSWLIFWIIGQKGSSSAYIIDSTSNDIGGSVLSGTGSRSSFNRASTKFPVPLALSKAYTSIRQTSQIRKSYVSVVCACLRKVAIFRSWSLYSAVSFRTFAKRWLTIYVPVVLPHVMLSVTGGCNL
jgi:hypothetical protein